MKWFRGSWRCGVAFLAAGLLIGAACLPEAKAGQISKSSEVPSGNADTGKQLFVKSGCYECHGREGQGSTMSGPRIAPDPVPFDVLVSYVRQPSGEMPPYTSKVISEKELADIYAYLQSRPHPPSAKTLPALK